MRRFRRAETVGASSPARVVVDRTPGGPLLAGRYALRSVIGLGASATVHRAEDVLLGRDVAVKLFAATSMTDEDLAAQDAEMRLAAALHHHALTTLFDAGVDRSDPDDPRVYLVMEHVPGTDLRTLLDDARLQWDDVCWLGFDLAEGLAHVHAAGFLHQDVKPANVLIPSRAPGDRIRGKLTDFGISTAIGRPGSGDWVHGTAAYLSPEQTEGLALTVASDVYSLGLVLLQAMTGVVAFPGAPVVSGLARLTRDPEIPDWIPPQLAAILRGMTARRPEERGTLSSIARAFHRLAVADLIDHRPAVSATSVGDGPRLTVVERYHLLDTPAEEAFDEITRLATRLLRTPVALVTIVDRDRTWFKSCQGFLFDQVDRHVAFCSTTDAGGSAWTVPDARLDARTSTNPLVVGEPHVQSYAAAPLVSSEGYGLGSLCVFDYEPRAFTPDELHDLTALAGLVMREFEIRRANGPAALDR